MKKKILRIFGVAASIACVAGLVVLILVRPPSFLRITEVVVISPLKHISGFDLIRLSGVKKGDNIVALSLAKVRQNLLRYPWIREVRLSRRIPARLLIWVEEQEPVALLEYPESASNTASTASTALYLVNYEGIAFKKAEPGDPKDLPILTGLAQEEIASRLPSLVAILKSIEDSELVGSLGVSEIRWSGTGGASLFTKDPCIRLELGSAYEGTADPVAVWETRLKGFSEAWKMIRSTAKRPKVVDLSMDRRIIVKQGFSTLNTHLKEGVH